MTVFASGFSWFHGLFPDLVGNDELVQALGDNPIDGTALAGGSASIVVHSWLACFFIIGLALLARMGLNRARSKQGIEQYFADETLTTRNGFELVVEAWLGLMGDMMPTKQARIFFPLIGTYFVYIFVCNIMGIFPGFLPPTDNVNTNVGMALIIFGVFIVIGLTQDPVGFIKHMMGNMTSGPLLFLGLFLFAVEIISFCIRPLSLTLRLTGNMFGDHMVFTVMSDLTYIVIPTVFLGLATFVSLIQAFIFSLLSATYIAGSLPHHDDDH